MPPSRRRLLQVGFVGTGLLALGTVGLALRRGDASDAPATLQVLDPAAWAVVRAVARVLCPSDGPHPDALDVAGRVDAQLARMHPGDAAEVQQALGLLDNALTGLVFVGTTVPFTDASRDDALALFRAWQNSSVAVLRTAAKAIRGLVLTAYFSHPDSFGYTGYPGPPNFGQAAAPAIQPKQAPAPAPETEASP